MTEMNSKQNCVSCKFFITGGILGECHRFPQSISKHENDWCGEHIVNQSYTPALYQIFASSEFDSVSIEKLNIKKHDTNNESKKRGRPARVA